MKTSFSIRRVLIATLAAIVVVAGLGWYTGHTHKLTWRRGDETGNYYYSEQFDKEGWLCPGLFKYYRTAPKEIYVKAEAIKGRETAS